MTQTYKCFFFQTKQQDVIVINMYRSKIRTSVVPITFCIGQRVVNKVFC